MSKSSIKWVDCPSHGFLRRVDWVVEVSPLVQEASVLTNWWGFVFNLWTDVESLESPEAECEWLWTLLGRDETVVNIWLNLTEMMPNGTKWRWLGYLTSAAVCFSISLLLLYFPRVSVYLLNKVSSALYFLPLSQHGFLVPSPSSLYCLWGLSVAKWASVQSPTPLTGST